ncbi:MAG: hypothetical protein HRU47_11685, partial [Verrucomicrobiales bacterium]|nr:hypothetical protein [Verrucomicrobiales bacterium]
MIDINMKEWMKFIVVGLVSLFPLLSMAQGPEESLTKSPVPKKAPEVVPKKAPEPAPEQAPEP